MSMMVKIVNDSQFDFIDRHDSQNYRVEPGETLQVPASAGYLWFGEPALLSDPNKRDKEENRVAARRPPIPDGVYMTEVPDVPDDLTIETKPARIKLDRVIEEGAFAELEKLKEEAAPSKAAKKASKKK
jgi:hypothetical protein